MARAVSDGVSLVADLKAQLETLEAIPDFKVVQRRDVGINGVFSTTNVIPAPGGGSADTPKITEGALLATIKITPTSVLNTIRLMVNVQLELSNTGNIATVAIFKNGATDAVQSNGQQRVGGLAFPLTVYYEAVAGTVSEIEFEIRFGPNGNTLTVVDMFLFGAGLVEVKEYKP